jgi:hypothetical protein
MLRSSLLLLALSLALAKPAAAVEEPKHPGILIEYWFFYSLALLFANHCAVFLEVTRMCSNRLGPAWKNFSLVYRSKAGTSLRLFLGHYSQSLFKCYILAVLFCYYLVTKYFPSWESCLLKSIAMPRQTRYLYFR